jgi:hypothetical protein
MSQVKKKSVLQTDLGDEKALSRQAGPGRDDVTHCIQRALFGHDNLLRTLLQLAYNQPKPPQSVQDDSIARFPT